MNKINFDQAVNAKEIKAFEDKFLIKIFSKINKENTSIVKSTLDALSDLSSSNASEDFSRLSQIKGLPEIEDDFAKLIFIKKSCRIIGSYRENN